MGKPRHVLGEWHSDQKKIEACTAYLVLGKAPLVEQVTGVPAGTIRRWKGEPWWEDLVAQIQTEDDQELDGKLAKRINKALDIVDDRLSSGDFMFNPATGGFTRRPVALKDTWKVTKEMVDLRQQIRKNAPKSASQETADHILKNLANEFAQMARRRLTEKVIDVDATELRPGIPEVSGETHSTEAASPAECSPSVNDETGQSSEGGQPGCGPSTTAGEGGIGETVQPASDGSIPESELRPYIVA